MMLSRNPDLVKNDFTTEILNWFTSNPKTKDKVRRADVLATFEGNALLIQVEALDGQYIMKFFNGEIFQVTASILADKLTDIIKNRMKVIGLQSYQLHIKVKYLSYLYEKHIQLSIYG